MRQGAQRRVVPGRPSSTPVLLGRDDVASLMLAKQHLGARPGGDDVLQVLDDLLGCHATVALSPYLQLRARIPTFASQQLDELLQAGRAAKVACMRRTLFIEPAQSVPIVLAATRELAVRGRERFLAANGLTPERYERVAERVEAELAGRALSARQLRDALRTGEPISPVIIVMCDQGRLVRWKGERGWSSAQPTYRRFDEVLPGIELNSWEEAAAVRELVERYVRRYGPVTENDISWWTGLTKTTVRDALALLPELVRARIEGSARAVLICEDDVAAAKRRRDTIADPVSLLPVLDPYVQGYRHREHCVDAPHLPFVVDRGGNSTSVILIGGRVAGVWGFDADPSPVLRLFFFASPDVGTRARVVAAAAETAEFLSGAPAPVVEVDRMTPLTEGTAGSFLSPLKDRR